MTRKEKKRNVGKTLQKSIQEKQTTRNNYKIHNKRKDNNREQKIP